MKGDSELIARLIQEKTNLDFGNNELKQEIARLRALADQQAARILELERGGYGQAANKRIEELESENNTILQWAVGRWKAEVSGRPLQNVHRRALDDTWRQIIRHLGGDPDNLCGPSHQELRDRLSDAEWRRLNEDAMEGGK